jgi:hypothetical protein
MDNNSPIVKIPKTNKHSFRKLSKFGCNAKQSKSALVLISNVNGKIIPHKSIESPENI